MDYKATLNLPKTDFPMKANLAQAEPKVLARWDEERLYEKLQTARKEAPPFILHDGPPYANGDIHIGHALNKILKDFILRYQSMRGRRAPYVPGWDCHGLPIEFALMKDLKTTKHKVDVVDFRKKARAYAQRFVDTQRQQFKRLGILGDWDHPYLTLHPEYVAAELRALAKIVSKGFVYRARKPVNWCWSCETALAEAEVEYDNLSSPSLYAKFPVLQDGPDKTYLVIWTTTPWTLMGNVAVAVHSDFTYAKRRVSPNEIWITLADLPKAALRDVKSASEAEVIETFPGKKLEGLRYRHPFEFREGKVVLADYVSAEDGTGLGHHGVDQELLAIRSDVPAVVGSVVSSTENRRREECPRRAALKRGPGCDGNGHDLRIRSNVEDFVSTPERLGAAALRDHLLASGCSIG